MPLADNGCRQRRPARHTAINKPGCPGAAAETPAHSVRGARIGLSRRPANTGVHGMIDYGVDNVAASYTTAEAILEVTHEWRRYAEAAYLCGDWCRGTGRRCGAAAG